MTMITLMMMTVAMTMLMTMMTSRAEIAASSVGSGFYEACLAFHTTTNKVSMLQHMMMMMMMMMTLVPFWQLPFFSFSFVPKRQPSKIWRFSSVYGHSLFGQLAFWAYCQLTRIMIMKFWCFADEIAWIVFDMGENTKNRELNLMDGTVGDGDGSWNCWW